jgi:hypothetical protein
MDASSTRPARGVAASLRTRTSAARVSSMTEVAPAHAISPPSAPDSSHHDLERRSGDNQREAHQPLTDPVGRALLDVLAGAELQPHADAQSALLRAKAYARADAKPPPDLAAKS